MRYAATRGGTKWEQAVVLAAHPYDLTYDVRYLHRTRERAASGDSGSGHSGHSGSGEGKAVGEQ